MDDQPSTTTSEDGPQPSRSADATAGETDELPYKITGRFRVLRDPQLYRVRQAIAQAWVDLDCAAPKRHDPRDAERIAMLLRKAHTAAEKKDVDSAWSFLYRCRELDIGSWDQARITSATDTLKTEATESGKFSKWRTAAIAGLVGRITAAQKTGSEDQLALQRELLMAAEQIRNESYGNEYRRLSIARRHQAILILLGAPILVSVVVVLSVRSALDGDLQSLGDGWLSVCSVLIGALGAITSAAQRSTRVRPDRIPTQLGSWLASVSRVPIGAIAGLTAWLSAEATLGADSRPASVLLLAFASGFTERLIVQEPTAGSGNGTTYRRP